MHVCNIKEIHFFFGNHIKEIHTPSTFFFLIITFEKWTPSSTEKLIRLSYFMIHSTRFDHKWVYDFFYFNSNNKKKENQKKRKKENSLRKALPPK